MKRIAIIRSLTAAIAVIALAFALASCGNRGDAQETADSTYEYDGRTVEFDITTMSSNLTWDGMQKAIDELNEKEYKGHSDWRMMESEDEVMAWWNAAGKNLYDSESLTPVYIIRTSEEYDDDECYVWYCDDLEWTHESKGEYDAVIGCFAVRG